MAATSPIGTLVCLPLEVREIIYGYLTPPSRLPTILRSRHLGVSSVSHRPPPLDALLVCRQLYAEALDVYYRKCVFKIDGLLDPANVWPLWQVEEVLGRSELGLATLANMRKIELNLFWHQLPEGGVVNTAIVNAAGRYGNLCKSEGDKRIERLGRAVQVLRNAHRLRSISLTWKEIPARKGEEKIDWAIKEEVLQTLGALRNVQVIPGDLITSDEVEMCMRAMIQKLNRKSSEPKSKRSRGLLEPHTEYLELVESTEQESYTNIYGKRNYQMSYFG